MKGEITLKILETIKDLTVGAVDLFEVIVSSGYGASYSKLQYELSKRQRERNSERSEKEFQRELKQKYHKLIYKLKRDGLIKISIKNNKKFFILTKKGRIKLDLLKEIKSNKLPAISYQQRGGEKFIIIIFDVPEAEKRKRDWLRVALRNLGFRMVQKSVWLGKSKVPKEFLSDLSKLSLLDFVEIFEISKSGSLKQIS